MTETLDAASITEIHTLSKRLHGQSLVIRGPAPVVHALGARLQYLNASAPAPNEGQLRFAYVEAKASEANLCFRPTGISRVFYEPLQGEATYWPDHDACYLQLGPAASTICYAGKTHCLTCLAAPLSTILWQATHPLFTLPLLEMMRRRNLYFVHAASLAFESRCLLLAGASGSGKSTLTLALLGTGASYMGDDLAFLDGEDASRILALPETISATQQTLDLFPGSERWVLDPRPAGWPKYEVQPHSLRDAPFCDEATPAALIFPRVAYTRASVLTSMHPDHAFEKLAANLLLTEAKCTKAHAASLAALARATPAYLFAVGTDLQEAAKRLRDLVA